MALVSISLFSAVIFSEGITVGIVSASTRHLHHLNATFNQSGCGNSFLVKGLELYSNFCSPWVFCDKGACKCGEIPNRVLQCKVGINVSLSNIKCITYNVEESLTEVGSCFYTKARENFIIPKSLSELNEFMCGNYSRTGTLCGRCKNGYYHLAYSFDMHCIHCPYSKANWWKYILAAYLPLTVFYFGILFLKINATSSKLYPYILFAQFASLPMVARVMLMFLENQKTAQTIIRWTIMLFGIWNLDFFRTFDLGICLETDALQNLALDIAVGVYPLLLMIITHTLIKLYDKKFKPIVMVWKPFKIILDYTQRSIDVRTSLIDAFCTFFLLANTKLLSSSFDLLDPVYVSQLNSTGHLTFSWIVYNDATVLYLGPRHLPYAILAILVLLFFALFPVLLLLLYPFRWFQKLLNILPARWYVLHTFVDSFQGCYKDGTEPGTCDCRWFASVFFIVRYFLMITGGLTFNGTYFPLGAMVLVVTISMLLVVRPFKDNASNLNYLTTMIMFLLALGHAAAIGINMAGKALSQTIFMGILFLVVFLTLLYIPVIVIHQAYKKGVFITLRRHGYTLLE